MARAGPAAGPARLRELAQARVRSALQGHPLRQLIFGWVLRQARARVRNRENLRFERTRVFGRVRRIFVEAGKRLAGEGRLDDPRDVFYLQVDEVLGIVEGTLTAADLTSLAAVRKREYDRYRAMPAPADRFETRGAVWIGNRFERAQAPVALGDDQRRGIGCCPGFVEGRARVVTDPRGALIEPGDILVAERTDPGWILLFPSAAAVVVERGSVLSHSAIVARELGIPAVVSVPGLTSWLVDGDRIAVDGASGVVRRVVRVDGAASAGSGRASDGAPAPFSTDTVVASGATSGASPFSGPVPEASSDSPPSSTGADTSAASRSTQAVPDASGAPPSDRTVADTGDASPSAGTRAVPDTSDASSSAGAPPASGGARPSGQTPPASSGAPPSGASSP